MAIGMIFMRVTVMQAATAMIMIIIIRKSIAALMTKVITMSTGTWPI